MARGTTLIRLLDLYRSQCKLSFAPAHNSQDRERQVDHIQRVQEWLWSDFDWPLLRVKRTFRLQNGQRYYDTPADLAIDRLEKIEVYHDMAYCPLIPGIDAQHYTAYNSDLDERQWPPQRWQITENEMLEIWPIPNGDGDPATLDGTVYLTGIRKLKPLVSSDDRADLDDRLIILFCAAEYLGSKGDKAADSKQQQANRLYAKLRGSQMPRRKFRLFGPSQDDYRYRGRIPIAVYNKTG